MTTFNAERNRITRSSILKKIEVLRDYLDCPPPSTAFVPKSVRQFRDWVDANLGLEKIGSPGTLDRKQSPHNRDLIDELDRVLREHALVRTKPRTKSPALVTQLKAAQDSLKRQRALTERLVSQLHEARYALEQAESKALAAITAKGRAEETIAELRKKLTHDKSFGIRVVPS